VIQEKKITEICSPKQWRNLPTSDFLDSGYPVYGANGVIGYYSEYNHEKRTIAITCRGATCGSIHVTQPYAYITSNAMALDNLDESQCNIEYLAIFLKKRGLDDVISGSAQPQITRTNLERITIPLPPLVDQIRIATLLSRVEALIATRKDNLRLLDEFLKSTFLEMFGDPVRNTKDWENPELTHFGKIITGNTPPRNNPDNYSSQFIEWIKTDNIDKDDIFISQASEYLSEVGALKSRTVDSGALLVACIAGSTESIGRAALTDRKISFNQQINAIQPNNSINPIFLYWLFRISRLYIQSFAPKGMKKIITKGVFEKIKMIKPPIKLQNQFATIVEKTESLKTRYQQNLSELENLYGALSQKAFKGELDLSRVPLQPQTEQEIDLSELVLTAKENVPEDIETTLASLNAFNQNASTLKDITRTARAASIDADHFESVKKAAAQIATYHSPIEQLKNMSGIASAMEQIESIIKPLNLNQFDAISRSAELARNLASEIPKLDMGWLEQHNDLLKQASAPFRAMCSAMEGIEALNYSGVNALIAKGAALTGLTDHHSEAIRKATELPASVRTAMDQMNRFSSITDPYRHLLGESWQSRLGYDPMANVMGMYTPPPFHYDDVLDVLTNAEAPITLEHLLQQLDEVGTVDFKGYERIKAILFDLLAEQQVTQVFDQKQNLLLFALVKEESPQ
jgi:restriction endonuclease S subunit